MNTEVIDAPAADVVLTDKRQGPVVARPQGTLMAVPTPGDLLRMAVESGADLDRLQKLMDMKERWDRLESEKAYNRAFAAFKAEAVHILRTKLITDGPLKGKKHAELSGAINAVTPALSRHGLSVAWRLSKDDKDWMEITCTLRHEGGHAESVSMGGPPDTGPGRNAMQARGSTKTYLERYTLTAICGLAAQDADDDGAGGPKQGIDIGGLLVGLGACASDGAALAYWNANRDSLKDDKKAYDKFKSEVMAHRDALKKGQQ